MRDVTKIDISKIDSYGKYIDLDIPEMYYLKAEDIIALRRYHNNPNIAKDFQFPKPTNEVSHSRSNPNYKVATDKNKYNNGHYRTKTPPIIKYGRRLIVGGLVVVFSFGVYYTISNAGQKKDVETPAIVATANPFLSPHIQDEINIDDIIESTLPENATIEPNEEISYEREIINHYCDIYQINPDVAYETLSNLTDNFTSEDFLANYHINGVTCKGRDVYASSEEEILLYAVRCLKQLPEQLNVSSSNLYIKNGYSSGVDYKKQISDISKLMGVDRALIYAICQSECNFNSDLFLNGKNPAGIRTEEGWWHFDTTEEGFIEICAEVIKYYQKIDRPLTDLSYDTLSKVRDIHAPLSDGNEYWLDNVWSILQSIKENENEFFNEQEQNNNLGR